MQNPSIGIYWLLGIVCAWPLIAFLLGILLGFAFSRGWFAFKVDPTKAPRLRIGRNG